MVLKFSNFELMFRKEVKFPTIHRTMLVMVMDFEEWSLMFMLIYFYNIYVASINRLSPSVHPSVVQVPMFLARVAKK